MIELADRIIHYSQLEKLNICKSELLYYSPTWYSLNEQNPQMHCKWVSISVFFNMGHQTDTVLDKSAAIAQIFKKLITKSQKVRLLL